MATEMTTTTTQVTTTITAQQAAALVAQAHQGDQLAIATPYEQYRPLVFRFLRRRLEGSEEVVEDLTEDVFVKLYEKLDRYVERGQPFTAWLCRITYNQLVDYLRTLPRQSAQPLDAVADVPERQTTAEYSSVLDCQILEPALARLTPEQRQAVELQFLQGMSVADRRPMGRSEAAVKKLQALALVNLRRALTPATRSAAPRMARVAA